ncbi:hypothetical protein [Mangrovimonas spongiae]|uniref:Uncharacterized protein n=1 Tax=Mangrovimonas spongiae TaxID=2494697 RepID=A0A428K551_9FLAO|nr:hypothetical protein [Mangrovimonas spongiae]RSK41546.1 hypothetical protein EJA19_01330 [Mangrovimonas spongiae]
MKTTQDLLQDISTLTRDIETNYPELYKYLDENPITIPNMEHPNIDNKALEDYLSSLKALVKKYKEEH